MKFDKIANNLIKEYKYEEGDEPYGYSSGTYEYTNEELDVDGKLYWVDADIEYKKHPEGIDITGSGITITSLYVYDEELNDNVEVDLNKIDQDKLELIIDHIQEDFLENNYLD